MRIAYLLDDTSISGDVRVVLAQADALIARGHEVVIATTAATPGWRASRAEWLTVDELSEVERRDPQCVIATSWQTLEPALALGAPRTLHLVQRREPDFAESETERACIEAAWRLPVAKIAVSKHLATFARGFHRDAVEIGQIVDAELARSKLPPENDPPRVLVVGAAQVETKGIDDAYGAVGHARWFGHSIALVRVSPWRPSLAEPVSESVDEFHVSLTCAEMTRVVHSCDVYLGTNRAGEGFGLPAAEAMAAGLPCVLTRIPSFLGFGEPHDYAQFASEGDPIDLGEKLVELLDDEELRARLRQRGRAVASRFSAGRVGEALEGVMVAGRLEGC
ncbi:MAG: glycosyltransferase family 4 protein [Acidobacteria bacterium]|nr:glycosyltransferase family 4 protein [Acidobacteriota bacterium]